MSLTKSNLAVIVSCVCIMLVLSATVFFPKVVDNLITGFASISSFSVSVAVLPGPNESNATIVPKIEPVKNSSLGFFSFRTRSKGMASIASFSEADQIEINATVYGVFEDYFILHNPENVKRDFVINFTNNFIRNMIKNMTLGPNESARISIPINTGNLEPGEYADYIFIRSGDKEEKITITLKMLSKETEPVENINPEQEQPKPITELSSEPPPEKKPAFLSIVIVFIGLLLVAGMIFLFFHLRRGMKAVNVDQGQNQRQAQVQQQSQLQEQGQAQQQGQEQQKGQGP
jgi:hypothetical protein